MGSTTTAERIAAIGVSAARANPQKAMPTGVNEFLEAVVQNNARIWCGRAAIAPNSCQDFAEGQHLAPALGLLKKIRPILHHFGTRL
jgi:hypothetical protein